MPPLPRTSASSARSSTALVSALEGLSDGLYGMFSKRLELFRLELADDAQRMGVWALLVGISAMVLALGYGLANLAVVLTVGAFVPGMGSMALTAGLLAAANLIAAALVLRLSVRRLNEARMKMRVSLDEFKKDQKWLQEIKDPSPSETATTSSKAS